jgi:hypothetical protein
VLYTKAIIRKRCIGQNKLWELEIYVGKYQELFQESTHSQHSRMMQGEE